MNKVIETLYRVKRSILGRIYSRFKPDSLHLKQVEYKNASFLVVANEDVGWRLISDKSYENDELECLLPLIKKDDVCVDIGGNIGIYSVFMAKKAYEGIVHVFEPSAFNIKIININIAINNVSSNVLLHDYVVSDRVGDIKFSVSEDSAYSSIIATNRKKEARSIETASVTLDEMFYSKGLRVDICKIDVEGAELLALKGAQKLLSDPKLRPRALLVELNQENQSVYDYRPEDVIMFMEKQGYNVHSIVKEKLVKGWPHKGCSEDALFMIRDID